VAYRVVGMATASEMKRLFEKIGSESEFSCKLCGIADLRQATFGTSVADVKELAMSVREQNGENCPWITLVSEPIVTALSLVFKQIVSERYQVQVCSTLERASSLAGRDILPFLMALQDAHPDDQFGVTEVV